MLLLYLGVAASEEALTLSENGIKELSLEKGFDLGRIKNGLPYYSVTEASNKHEILIHSGNELIITLHRLEKGLFNIEIHSNKVRNLLGHNIGDTFHSVYNEPIPQCRKNADNTRLACSAPNSKKIIYIFTCDVIGSGEEKLVSIFWSYEWMGLHDN